MSLPVPPILGLQGKSPMESRLMVRIKVFIPILLEAKAASQPAWPAPTTIIS